MARASYRHEGHLPRDSEVRAADGDVFRINGPFTEYASTVVLYWEACREYRLEDVTRWLRTDGQLLTLDERPGGDGTKWFDRDGLVAFIKAWNGPLEPEDW